YGQGRRLNIQQEESVDGRRTVVVVVVLHSGGRSRAEGAAIHCLVPVIASAEELQEADGVLFGFPTRYDTLAARLVAGACEMALLGVRLFLPHQPTPLRISFLRPCLGYYQTYKILSMP
ncbi:unnamed protein product, partial [Urochloa humidicola]